MKDLINLLALVLSNPANDCMSQTSRDSIDTVMKKLELMDKPRPRRFAVGVFDNTYGTNMVLIVNGNSDEEALINAALVDREEALKVGNIDEDEMQEARELLIGLSNDDWTRIMSVINDKLDLDLSIPVEIVGPVQRTDPASFMKKMDKLAKDMFGEFGYDTCSAAEKLSVLTEALR